MAQLHGRGGAVGSGEADPELFFKTWSHLPYFSRLQGPEGCSVWFRVKKAAGKLL